MNGGFVCWVEDIDAISELVCAGVQKNIPFMKDLVNQEEPGMILQWKLVREHRVPVALPTIIPREPVRSKASEEFCLMHERMA